MAVAAAVVAVLSLVVVLVLVTLTKICIIEVFFLSWLFCGSELEISDEVVDWLTQLAY